MYNIIIMSNGVEYELPFYFRIPIGTILKDRDGREFSVNSVHKIDSIELDANAMSHVVMKNFEPRFIYPEDGDIDVSSEI